MRNAFNIEIARSITRSLSRFLAIFAIVALGAGFYAGLRMCAPDMRLTVEDYFNGTSFMDIQLVSTLGFSDDDVEAVRNVAGVSAVMPAHSADVIATVGDRRTTLRVHGLDIAVAAASESQNGAHVSSDDENYLNRPLLAAGRWPSAPGECVIDSSKVYSDTAQLGDTVTFEKGIVDLDETFNRTSFTVVGVVDSSYYLSFSRGNTTLDDGTVDRFIYISNEEFVNPDIYSELFLTVSGAVQATAFSDEYDTVVDPVVSALKEITPERETARLTQIRADAQSTLDEARLEYETARGDADAQFSDAEAEIERNRLALEDAEAQYASGQESYKAGVAQLAASRAAAEEQIAAASAQLADGQTAIDTQQTQLEELGAGIAFLQTQIEALELSESQLQVAYEAALLAEAAGETPSPSSSEIAASLVEVRANLAAMRENHATQSATYAAGLDALAQERAKLVIAATDLEERRQQGEAELASAQAELDSAQAQLASSRADIDDGKGELEAARQLLEQERADAEDQLAQALASIEEGERELDALDAPVWYVLGRDANTGYASFSGDAERIEKIAVVFPFIFFLVAALVALTTMTRMVDEERTLIGVHKALGYSKARIASKYLIYAGLASVLGSIFGIAIGSQVLPVVIWSAYTTMYTAPALLTPVDMSIALASAGAATGVTLVATLASVWATLRERPAALMRPRAPKPGKRIFLEQIKPIWTRFSFLHKVTARNLFRYKKRFFMTVIGIAGCTALLLTGFGLKDSIGDVLAKQYDDIFLYNTTIGFTGTGDTLEEALDEQGAFSDHLSIRTEGVRIENEAGHAGEADEETGTSGQSFGGITGGASSDTSVEGYLRTPAEVDRLEGFVALHARSDTTPLTPDERGVILTEKAARILDLDVGDTVYLERLNTAGDSTEEAVPLTVTGITEQYVSHYVYIAPDLYAEVFGEEPVYNEMLTKTTIEDEDARDELSQTLLETDGVATVQFNDDITESFDGMLRSLNSVVAVLIVSAGMLAFIVLYNLTNINVTERKRELATIKVLGFYDPEVYAYIYRETLILATIGCVLGLALGVGLESFVITTVEVDVVMFGRTIHPASYFFSAALTMLFALIVTFAMRRRLRNINMTESLKSNE